MRGEDPRVQPPALDAYSDVPLYNTKAVVYQTGVPAPTLRAWERRYGILSPRRGGNDYRLYSERDIVTVVWLRERVQGGMTISQAIALLQNLQSQTDSTQLSVVDYADRRARSDGGRREADAESRPQYSLIEMRDTLLRELLRFDERSARRILSAALAVHSVEDVCVGLLTPTMKAIGEMWAHGETNVVTEHFATNVVRSQLESIFRGTGQPERGPIVLVGCAPGELHEIGVLMVAVCLRRASVRTLYLGQSVESAGLLDAIVTLRPAAVVLSSVMPESVRPVAELAGLVAGLPGNRPLFGFGGPAFVAAEAGAASIPGLLLDADLELATDQIRMHVGN